MPKPKTRKSSRTPLWIGAALLALVGAWLIFRPGALPPPAPRHQEPAPSAQLDPTGRYIPRAPTSGPQPIPADVPLNKEDFNRKKAEMSEAALKDVETWLKYPLWSSPLTENMRYQKPEPFHTISKSPGDVDPSVELWPEKLHYAVGEQIRINAVFRNGGPARPDSLSGRTFGGSRPRPELALDFQDRGDGTLVANLNLSDEVARRNRGEWGVILESFVAGQRLGPTTQFYIMATDAKVSGPYRVAVEEGSLSVYVGVTGSAPSRQHLKGELWGPKGEPLAYAWARDDNVHVGLNTMKLVFYGKVIRDSGVNGPYEIRNLLLTTFDESNDRIENPAVDPQLKTEAWAHTLFTDKSINGSNEALLEKKEILKEELENARKGLYDPHDPIPPRTPHVSKDAPPPQ